jgi:SAM-dependent methyltransferase
MTDGAANPRRSCWCGDSQLTPFSPEYLSCARCGTLVSQVGLGAEQACVRDDDRDYYGKDYWLKHQSGEFGLPEIHGRTRRDLPERCLHWLRTVLAYRPPPARVLELGCAHGAFVALLRWAGYDAAGLEVSPWVVEFARRTFGVPVYLGPVEQQPLPPASLDVIVLNDLLEHLTDPLATLGRCAELLADDGLLVVQTPCFPEELSHEELSARGHRFLEMMTGEVTVEHVYLYSRRALERLLAAVGFPAVCYEPAIFGHYDMYCVAGRRPPARAPGQGEGRLEAVPAGRLVLALLDKGRQADEVQASLSAHIDELRGLLTACETGRALDVERYRHDCAARQERIDRLEAELDAARHDLAAAHERLASYEAELPFRLARMAVRARHMPGKLFRLWRNGQSTLATFDDQAGQSRRR